MTWDDVQALVLRPARARAVRHLLLRVRPGHGGEARRLLQQLLQEAPLTVGSAELPPERLHCTLGFSYRGLDALGMPAPYLRVFSRLAPAFAQGAPLRGDRLGDSGASAPARWTSAFALDNAHVLVTVHGERARIERLAAAWSARCAEQAPLRCMEVLAGERLGAPERQEGQWVHFGYRDGIVDRAIDGLPPSSKQGNLPQVLRHAAGEFLLGHRNDNGFNPFALPVAPVEVRSLVRDSSFGVLRPMQQDVHQFEQAVQAWRKQAEAALGHAVGADWVRAKLGGRWPTGEAIRPGQLEPQRHDVELDFAADGEATGCPFFSHVRRMDGRGHAGVQRPRALLRRGMPYGPANWAGTQDGERRGLLGLFFCAGLEDQFEQLVGQWGSGPPPGGPAGNFASDPFAGHAGGSSAAAVVPLPGGRKLQLSGFRPWTQTLGTVYTWHPAGQAVERILAEDYLPPDDGRPWL